MNKYELTLVLDGKVTPAKKKVALASIEKLIKVLGGKLIKTEDMGVHDLAYKIGKSTTGNYLRLDLELDVRDVKTLPVRLKTETDIIRHLLIKNG